jgi:protein TonB
LSIALVTSLVLHLGVGGALAHLAKRPKPPPRPAAVTVAVVEKITPKPPEPEKPPEPPKPPPKPVPMKMARAPKPVKPQELPPTPLPPPPVDAPPPPSQEAKQQTTPVVLSGITLESTSGAGSFAVNTGNTLYGDPGRVGRDPSTVKPYKAERYAPAAQVSELPNCSPMGVVDIRKFYPLEARKKEIEGVVTLKLLIDSDGSLAKIDIISDPGEGLGQAALKVMTEYRCTPGKVNGVAVATSVPFKVRFELN